ncbi:MAG TPA: tRNA uridine-5-carboxymethylaminomethyl(34) synthesis GTPase MnmE [Methylomirabilota bacterium]|jgi:tRNA modification GTPase|nr:tRNA uridine-5-carboxymethylaminomethyl(34) synthesis GTPase MnmE [Methylomirabilota bacterium]
MKPLDDTIAALATAPGPAGLAVLRVSGGDALAVSDRVFRGSAPLARAAGHTLHHGWAVDAAPDVRGPERRLDEVVAAVFRAPRSFTGEDTVEWSCHGGALPARRVLDALLAAGARLAGPGEFSLRAFLRGRIDLAQAEAIADLVHAETESAGDLALAQLSGVLSRRLAALEERLLDSVAEVEARVDFADDVGGVEVPTYVRDAIAAVLVELDALLESAPWGRAVREGVRIPIVGRPNAGKSSLFNALLGEERAIVAAEPGTTRDRVSERLVISGVPVTLSDTAGVRDARDPVEAMGVERSLATLEGAAVVLWVVDGSRPFTSARDPLEERLSRGSVVVALTKSDLGEVADPVAVLGAIQSTDSWAIPVSSLTGEGMIELRAALAVELGAGSPGGLASAIANPRHTDAITRARAALARAGNAADTRAPGEIVALELRESLAAIGEVSGRQASEELLERIFARFCIGK